MFARLLVLVLSLFLLTLSIPTHAQNMQKSGGVLFSNMAPGETISDDMKKAPLKLTFSSESGIMYGGVFVRIFNASGIAVLKVLCEKPWLFVQLPVGDYHVVAVDRNKMTRIKPFHLNGGGKRQLVLDLRWPREAVGY